MMTNLKRLENIDKRSTSLFHATHDKGGTGAYYYSEEDDEVFLDGKENEEVNPKTVTAAELAVFTGLKEMACELEEAEEFIADQGKYDAITTTCLRLLQEISMTRNNGAELHTIDQLAGEFLESRYIRMRDAHIKYNRKLYGEDTIENA